MRILGIESSCDETGVALYDTERGLLSESLFSQTVIHAPYGGVVPELASRDHVRRLPALVRAVLAEAGVERPDAVAVTAGPGLIGAVLVGVSFAKALAAGWELPLLPIHHLEGHLLAPLLEAERPDFPFLALLVSGGHTLLAEVQGLGRYRILGETLDDAAGEAFDKTAKLMGLGYPGGPAVADLAAEGEPSAFALPRPLLDRPGLDFSFSGLKTAVRLALDGLGPEPSRQGLADLAASFQAAAVDTLAGKAARALRETGLRRLVAAGGVAANMALRRRLADLGTVYYPRPRFCTDNGAMIALAGAMRFQAGERPAEAFTARARWPLETLESPS